MAKKNKKLSNKRNSPSESMIGFSNNSKNENKRKENNVKNNINKNDLPNKNKRNKRNRLKNRRNDLLEILLLRRTNHELKRKNKIQKLLFKINIAQHEQLIEENHYLILDKCNCLSKNKFSR